MELDRVLSKSFLYNKWLQSQRTKHPDQQASSAVVQQGASLGHHFNPVDMTSGYHRGGPGGSTGGGGTATGGGIAFSGGQYGNNNYPQMTDMLRGLAGGLAQQQQQQQQQQQFRQRLRKDRQRNLKKSHQKRLTIIKAHQNSKANMEVLA
eukprot:TRINITY_DN31133_c0_g1_i1.p1 TRINITY_DN31133_c0_g1~~TRINITY_DN31133_c0_g1_i1.p1  ORF type:complete len:150 (+),score=9.11 TRINITY_DN31133_c0_g1_i1:248-697(+)